MKPRAVTVLPLLEYIPAVSPRFRAPVELAPLVDAFERTEREAVQLVGTSPPRHMKTTTIAHGIVRRLRKSPGTRIAYVTYAARYAAKRSREFRQLYQRTGGRVIASANTVADWRTTDTGTDDGGLWATSVGGQITGEGFDLIIIDDAVRSRAVAESAVEREKLWDWFTDTLYTRKEPGGSLLVWGTRWTPDDLQGRLIADGWESVNLAAINDRGEALCPDRYPLAALARIKATLGEYGWQSLYQGNPFARGGTLFQDTYFYEQLPAGQMRVRIGVDFAYTKKTRADYSAYVILGELAGSFYVLEANRQQVIAPEFKRTLDAVAMRYPGVRPFAYVGGQERGVVDLMNAQGGVQIDTKPASEDKFLRAQGVAAQWNQGRVLLPRTAPWLEKFVDELIGFTGSGDLHDDYVDALSSAYAGCKRGPRESTEREKENARAAIERLRNPPPNPLDGFIRLGGAGRFGD